MPPLANAARWEITIVIAAFGVVTLWKLFQSGDFTGLLRSADGSPSPARMQMLVLTVLIALQYLLATIHDPSHLPPLPAALVAVLAGSHSVYLGAKAWDLLGRDILKSLRNSQEQK